MKTYKCKTCEREYYSEENAISCEKGTLINPPHKVTVADSEEYSIFD